MLKSVKVSFGHGRILAEGTSPDPCSAARTVDIYRGLNFYNEDKEPPVPVSRLDYTIDCRMLPR